MRSNNRIIRPSVIFLIVMFAIGFSSTSIDEIFEPVREQRTFSCLPSETRIMTQPSSTVSEIYQSQITSKPLLAYLFQLLFILFLISPPTIAVLLFLILKELKERNKMK